MLYFVAFFGFACGVVAGRALRRPRVRIAVGGFEAEATTVEDVIRMMRLHHNAKPD
ncbi:MAG: hypothetical protein V4793_01425 [Paraburkholderia tropica]